MSDLVAVKALISGRVQGVFYRGWTEEQAVRRGLAGWVRNNPDGSVSALFIGQRIIVDEMLEVCRKGPRAARVDGIEASPVNTPPEGAPERLGFRILR